VTILGGGNSLGLQEGLEAVCLEVIDEGLEGGYSHGVNIAGVGELFERITGVDEADAREVGLGDTDELSEAGLDAVGDAGVHKED